MRSLTKYPFGKPVHKVIKSALVPSVFLSLVSTTVLAATFDASKVGRFDLNNDGLINPGKEARSLAPYQDQMDAVAKGALFIAENEPDPNGGVPLTQFSSAKWFDVLQRACQTDQRFFLRDRAVDSSLLVPSLRKGGGKQATLSATHNNLNNIWSWDVKGAITMLPYRNRCLVDGDWKGTDLTFNGAAIAPFVEFAGSGTSRNRGDSSLRFGANIELQTIGGVFFDLQQFNILPYYQTDFGFDAEVYGVQASWQPVKLGSRLGGYIGLPQKFNYWWTLQAEVDFLSVQDPGRTNLAADTEYGWLSAEIGGHAEYIPDSGGPIVFADVSRTFRQDVLNSKSANLTTATLGFYFDESRNTSLLLKYENGTAPKTLNRTDKVVLQFGIKY